MTLSLGLFIVILLFLLLTDNRGCIMWLLVFALVGCITVTSAATPEAEVVQTR